MRNYYKLSIFTLVFSLAFFTSQAQDKNYRQPGSIIQLDASQQTKNSNDIFAKHLRLSKENSYQSLGRKTDNIGITHESFQQFYKGIPVAFGKATIDSKNGKRTALHGEFYNVRNVSNTPNLSAAQALQKALTHLGGTEYMWERPAEAEMMNYSKPEGELLILPNLDATDKNGEVTEYNLAYKFDIYMTQPRIARGYMYIDAMSGAPLFYDAIIKHAGEHSNSTKNLKEVHSTHNHDHFLAAAPLATGNASTRYSGNQTITTRTLNGPYVLRDNTRGNGINTLNSGRTETYPVNDFTDTDNNWTSAEYNNSAKDNAALDVHWGTAVTYDYWSSEHNRNSFDGNGAAINSWVHYGVNYDNAFWNGSVMTYGDGSSNGAEGNGYFDALSSIDVAAHEIGHAITNYTADLAYQRESGGLNEGFSDIWGAAVEHFAKGNGNDAAPDANVWLIGEEIDRRNGSAALRSMSNPKALRQPDTYRGTYWVAATVEEGCTTPIGDGSDPNYNDYCGVHTNSGVLNYWFYLTVAGSANTDGVNDNGTAFNVSGIGMNKSAKIAYRTLNVYLTANATFMDTRNGSIQAAKDLYGAGGAEEQAVTNAWHAVGVGQAYGDTSYCASKGNSTSDEYISRVQLADIDNTSGANGGYGDYTSVATNLSAGQTYTVTVTPTWTGSKYNEGYSVWIDYNQNGSFTDAGEQVMTQSPTQNSPVSGSFTVPAGVAEGSTRMRVSMKYNGVPSSCEAFDYGEVEDYTIVFGTSTQDTEAPSVPTSLTTGAITETSIALSWNASTDNVGVVEYNVYQDNILLGATSNTAANITGLTSGTNYSFKVQAVDAAGNTSGFSNVVSATTVAEIVPTGCTNGIASFPYNEGFESGFGAWTQTTADDLNWDRNSGSTPSGGTGPSSANEGSSYIFVEASGDGTGFPSKQAILISPCFDLSGVDTAIFEFDYHMFGADDMGSIAVEASTDNGTTWTSVWSETGNQGDSWNTTTIDLDSYIGGTVKLRFNRITGATWKADIAIDNIALKDSIEVVSTDPCDGVLPYNGNTSYQVGDRVTYNGTLYERQSTGWVNLGACGSANGIASYQTATEFPGNNQIRLYPMPVRAGKLNVAMPEAGAKAYTIHNLLGQKVDQGKLTDNVNVTKLEAGVYLIKIDGYKAQRFVVE